MIFSSPPQLFFFFLEIRIFVTIRIINSQANYKYKVSKILYHRYKKILLKLYVVLCLYKSTCTFLFLILDYVCIFFSPSFPSYFFLILFLERFYIFFVV